MPEYVYFYFFIFWRKLLILTKNFIEVLSHIFRKESALEFIPNHLLTPCIIVISFPLNLHDHFDFFPRCRYFLAMFFFERVSWRSLISGVGSVDFPRNLCKHLKKKTPAPGSGKQARACVHFPGFFLTGPRQTGLEELNIYTGNNAK
jgi:hypothetical protein